MNTAIQVEGLTKSYGERVILKGLTFQVRKGEIFALLGANGAGKTTTLECMEGLRRYNSGSIKINGKKGIQLQSASLPEHIRPMEAIQLFAKWNRAKINEAMLVALGIHELKKMQYRNLSTGQKRRLHLALALISDPDIVFLDEPTAGLDVEGRISLHSQIRKLKEQGKTILLSSHDMAEVESLCDRIAILNDGKIAFSGTVAELTEEIGSQFIIHIKTSQGEEEYESENIGESMLLLLNEYQQKGVTVQDIKIDRGTLEQHFMKIAGGKYK